MQIAIIGAGISGLACARELRAKGHTVTIFEKSQEVGGRIVTQDTELGGFDYGAQFFTASSDGFKAEISSWRKAGLVAPWHGRLVRLEDGSIKPARPSSQRFVALPGMGKLTQFLAEGLDVRTGYTIKHLESTGKPGKPQWLLTVDVDGAAGEAQAGPFDAVVVATPANNAASLLKSFPALASKAEKTPFVACWSLMLAFQQPLDLEYDGAWVNHHRLAWVARDGSKPDRREGERWVALAQVEWSEEHLHDTPERAKEKLLKAFQESTGVKVQPIHAVARFWQYAQSTKPLTKSCLWDEKLKLGACGDWFTAGLESGGQVEHAYMSGQMLAARIGG